MVRPILRLLVCGTKIAKFVEHISKSNNVLPLQRPHWGSGKRWSPVEPPMGPPVGPPVGSPVHPVL